MNCLPASAEARRNLPTPGIAPSPELTQSLRRLQSLAQKSLRTTMLMPPGTGRVAFRIRPWPGWAAIHSFAWVSSAMVTSAMPKPSATRPPPLVLP